MATSTSSSRTDFVFMLVALYFILISFFIIISTLSVRDSEKLQSAVNSITSTFKVNDRLAAPVKTVEVNSYNIFLGDLQGWISNLYSLGNVFIVRRGGQVAITIKQPDFFIPGTAQFNENATKALKQLADLLATWQVDYVSELEVVADEPTANVNASAPLVPSLGARHAGAIAAYLTQRGIAPQALSVSMRDKPESVLAFTFIIRIPPKMATEK